MNAAPWRVEVTRSAQRDLRRLDAQVRRRVNGALVSLAEDPLASTGLRKLTGRPETRLRVGDWRVLLILDAKRGSSWCCGSCPGVGPTATDGPAPSGLVVAPG